MYLFCIKVCFVRSPRGQAPWREENVPFIVYILYEILMHIVDVILMHVFDVPTRMHILDVWQQL